MYNPKSVTEQRTAFLNNRIVSFLLCRFEGRGKACWLLSECRALGTENVFLTGTIWYISPLPFCVITGQVVSNENLSNLFTATRRRRVTSFNKVQVQCPKGHDLCDGHVGLNFPKLSVKEKHKKQPITPHYTPLVQSCCVWM